MYAIVKAGGKQHKVEVKSVIKTELENAEVGQKIQLPVVMIGDGKDVIVGDKAAKAKVVAEVLEHGKDKKIVVFTYKAKKRIKSKQGHRQPFSKLKIISIEK